MGRKKPRGVVGWMRLAYRFVRRIFRRPKRREILIQQTTRVRITED